MEELTLKFGLIGVLGIGAQWIAWRTGWPAIALMLAAGIIAGPVAGVIDPATDFGPLLSPMISIAVAVILFDGGLSLNFRELKHAGAAVLMLVLVGGLTAWGLGSLAAHYLAGLSWPTAILFAGILIVTGPTVVGPLLRQLNMAERPKTLLKWEAIVNDPIGALLAVFVYEYYSYLGTGRSPAEISLEVGVATVAALALGLALAFFIRWSFPRGWIPEFLKAPVTLVLVIGGFVVANAIEHETGLLTVTAMGVALANMRLESLAEMRRFKESISVVLISGVFVILSATLNMDVLTSFRIEFVVFLVALLFVVRPLSVLIALLPSRIPWAERLFVAWIAPRGIVAVAISGLFALRLAELGYEDGLALIPLSFAVVIVTIVAHGFTAGWLAGRLGLAREGGKGVLVVGATPLSRALVGALRDLEVPVTIADTSWHRLRPARRAGLPVYHGEILSEVTQDRLHLGQFQALIAATDNDAYNALVCTDLGPEVGRADVYQVGTARTDERHQLSPALRGRALFSSGLDVHELEDRIAAGWRFVARRLSEEAGLAEVRAALPPEAELVFVRENGGGLRFFTHARKPSGAAGDVVVAFVPPGTPVEDASEPGPMEPPSPAAAPARA